MGPISYDYIAVLYAEKAAYDRARGFEQPITYYISSALGALNELYEKERSRLLVLATKHCPNKHRDFEEIKRIAGDL